MTHKNLKMSLEHPLFWQVIERAYGEDGLKALDRANLTADDFAQGEIHCLARLTPYLQGRGCIPSVRPVL